MAVQPVSAPGVDTTVPASIHFLARLPLYKAQKPYTIRYALPGDSPVPQTNTHHEEIHNIPITDIRNRESEFSLAQHGFSIIDHDTGMAYDDFASEDRINDVYLPSVARKLRELFGAKHVQVYEHVIRRRDPEFPVSTGKSYATDQPTNSAHVDVTEDHISQLVGSIIRNLPADSDVAKCMPHHHIQCINIWRPLRGPLTDWPLCVCDASTINASADLVPSDIVFTQHALENMQVHYDPKQKWYYLSEQREDELWCFVQSIGVAQRPGAYGEESNGVAGRAGIAGDLVNGTPHCAFHDQTARPNGIIRESIECRALVYFGDCIEA